jgi:hypothetical protein
LYSEISAWLAARRTQPCRGGPGTEEGQRRPGARGAELALFHLVQPIADPAVANELPAHQHIAGIRPLKMIDATQEGRLSGAGGADYAHHLARVDIEIDALQHLHVAKALVNLARDDHRL